MSFVSAFTRLMFVSCFVPCIFNVLYFSFHIAGQSLFFQKRKFFLLKNLTFFCPNHRFTRFCSHLAPCQSHGASKWKHFVEYKHIHNDCRSAMWFLPSPLANNSTVAKYSRILLDIGAWEEPVRNQNMQPTVNYDGKWAAYIQPCSSSMVRDTPKVCTV